jgi:cellulose synthase/poly-beta-1,6-N-acetylglucosamine synthase-like glycosyltransferase
LLIMLALLTGSLALLIYVYLGYPIVLQAIVWIRGPRPVRQGTGLPRVSLVISAFNEAAVMREKLENALRLDYPIEALQIVVVSDASDDGTDEIVRAFAPRVQLMRQPHRVGKTAGLNRVVPKLIGDVVVFSDANAMYEPDALRMLIRNFDDPTIGCVTGEARYLKGDRSAAAISERMYWDYEIWIKRLETAVGSMVGGDGAIYAIRRRLWRELPGNAINDFLNPLQIVVGGHRAVYEPHAICYEETAGGVRVEWRRRIRIISRSWRAVFQAHGALNPFRVGLFAFSLLSHKVLRWFSGLFILLAAGAATTLLTRAGAFDFWTVVVPVLVAVAAISLAPGLRRPFAFVFYFVVINAASIAGLARGTFGNVSGIWTTARSDQGPRVFLRPGFAILAAGAASVATAVLLLATGGRTAAVSIFWTSLGLVIYVYAGYPLLLRALARVKARPVFKSSIEPRVCLLIAANDEAAVIAAKLENSLRLDYPADRLRVVVASDGSRDRTNEIVRSFEPRGVRLLAFPERRGKISAINDGMQSIDAEIVVMSDANTFLSPTAVRMLVRNFADEEVGAVSGDVVLTGERASLAGSEDLYYRYERALQRLESEVGSLIGVDGALYAVRRELFVPQPADTILDDMAIPMAVARAGYRIVFEGEALADEAGSSSSSEEFSRKSRVVAGAVQFLSRPASGLPLNNIQPLFTLISHKALRWLSPAFAALGFVSSLLLAPGSSFFTTIAIAALAVVAAGALGCVPPLRRISFVGLAHYLCLVQTAAAFGLVKGLSGRQAIAWRRFARVLPT